MYPDDVDASQTATRRNEVGGNPIQKCVWKICDAAVHVACMEHFSWLEGVADTLKVLPARDLQEDRKFVGECSVFVALRPSG